MTVTENLDRFSVQELEFLYEEHQKIKAVLNDVKRRVGMAKKHIDLKISWDLIEYAGNHTAAATTEDGTIPPKIGYTPFITKEMNLYQLAGILAHELGHFHFGDTENMTPLPSKEVRHHHELRADLFAAQHGFGENLIASFEYAKTLIPHWMWNKSGPGHPGILDRIERIKSYLNQTEKKAA